MEIERHVHAIQADLAAAAELGGEDVAEAGRRLAEAAGASLQLRIIDVLTDASIWSSWCHPSVGSRPSRPQVTISVLA
jgi:hypothetical protein